ncbi:MAG: 23S rRNA (adenine(2503)-C(2))-methyltransferase RlmN [Caldicoprobacterales bacterium]
MTDEANETMNNKHSPMKDKIDILDRTPEELISDMELLGERPYRGEQVFQWLYQGAASFSEMTNLPKTLRRKLEGKYIIGKLKQLKRLVSSDKRTIKYLYLLADNNIIECVLMKYHYGNTLCLSTQVGCAMGCSFCASATGGLVRQLTAGEMMAQILEVNRDIAGLNWEPVSGVVLMGSGEPLDNYENTMKFLHQVHNPRGYNMSWRKITLSTCGLVPKIRLLADEEIGINLAVSLHAPNDKIRRKIMKIANAYTIEEVIGASKYYFEKTGRRVTFEYALISNVNDNPEHAFELSRLLKGFPNHVNLIPLNENRHSSQKRSQDAAIQRFVDILKSSGVNVTQRREMGLDIQGACGQLKTAYYEEL